MSRSVKRDDGYRVCVYRRISGHVHNEIPFGVSDPGALGTEAPAEANTIPIHLL